MNAYLVKTGIETTTDTAIDLVTGRPVTPETVFQNLSMNLIGNGVPLLPLGDNKPKVNAPYKPETVTSNFGNTYDITPSKIHTKTTTDNSKIYGTPNSSVYIYIYNKKTGELVTRRYYDENGRVYRDVDMTDHGNPKRHPEVPHQHIWQFDEYGNKKVR